METPAPVVEEAKPPDTPKTFPLTVDGKQFDVSGQDLIELAQQGAQTILDKQKAPEPAVEEKPLEELTINDVQDQLKKSNQEFQDYKAGQEKASALHEFKSDLDTSIGASDLMKEYPELIDNVKLEVAARMSNNANLKVSEAVRVALDGKLKLIEKINARKNHATTKVKSILNQVENATGGIANMEAGKPLTRDYVTSGKSQRDIADALRELLE